MSMGILYWFIGLLFLVLFIIWIDSLLCNDKVEVHPSIEKPLENQMVWAYVNGRWIYGQYDSLTDYSHEPYLFSDGKGYSWDDVVYWVDLNSFEP